MSEPSDCTCPLGPECPYRDDPPGDPDTEHCQQCGAWMPDDGDLDVGDEMVCNECGATYTIGEPEES